MPNLGDLLTQFGIAGFMIFMFYLGGKTKLWVFGHQFDDMRKERDWWREAAIRGSITAEVVAKTDSKKLTHLQRIETELESLRRETEIE